MIEKIWTAAQIQRVFDLQTEYKIPQEVTRAVQRAVEILDAEYGAGRDVDNDDGGYVLLLLPDNSVKDRESIYLEVLMEYQFRVNTAEIESVLCKDGCWEWLSDLFLRTNEYGIMVVYPLKRM